MIVIARANYDKIWWFHLGKQNKYNCYHKFIKNIGVQYYYFGCQSVNSNNSLEIISRSAYQCKMFQQTRQINIYVVTETDQMEMDKSKLLANDIKMRY